MFCLRLRPTPTGFALGIAMIAFWALLWVWFIVQLVQPPRPAAAAPAAGAPEMTSLHAMADRAA